MKKRNPASPADIRRDARRRHRERRDAIAPEIDTSGSFDAWDISATPSVGFWQVSRDEPSQPQRPTPSHGVPDALIHQREEELPTTVIPADELAALQEAQRAADARRAALAERGLSRDGFFVPDRVPRPEREPDTLLPGPGAVELEPLTEPGTVEPSPDTFRPAEFAFQREEAPKTLWQRIRAWFS